MQARDLAKYLKTKLSEHQLQISKGWENFSRNRRLPDAVVIDVENKSSLQAVAHAVAELNKSESSQSKITYRPAAGDDRSRYLESFSFSPCVEADIIVRLTGSSFKEIKYDEVTETVEVGAAVQVGELDKLLYQKYDRVLSTSSLFGWPTTVGLSANAGHGAGKDQPGFAGLIEELTVCKTDGTIVTINNKHPDFATIRAGHLGLYGIVISQKLKTIPAKKIHASLDASNIESLNHQIDSGLIENNKYLSVMYVPTYREQEELQTKEDNVLILKMNPVSRETKDRNHCPELEKIGQDLSIMLQEAFEVPDILVKYPKLIPHYMRYIVSDISIGKDREIIGPWYDVMHYQKAFPWKIDDADYLFEVSKDNHEIKQAMLKMAEILDEFKQRDLYPVTYAIYFRVFKGTNGGMSTSQHSYGKRVCGFDIVSHPQAPGYLEFKKVVQDYFVNELKAKPHWGKTVPMDIDYPKLYGQGYNDFMGALSRWYGGENALKKSPLLTPYYAKILKIGGQGLGLFGYNAQAEVAKKEVDKARLLKGIKMGTQYGGKLMDGLFNIFYPAISSDSEESLDGSSELSEGYEFTH